MPGVAARVGAEWAKRDPAAAAQWALRQSDPQASSFALQAVASTWLRDDGNEAVRWALSLDEESEKERMLLGLLSLPQSLTRAIDVELLEVANNALRSQAR
jgi:hypothetical protein